MEGRSNKKMIAGPLIDMRRIIYFVDYLVELYNGFFQII